MSRKTIRKARPRAAHVIGCGVLPFDMGTRVLAGALSGSGIGARMRATGEVQGFGPAVCGSGARGTGPLRISAACPRARYAAMAGAFRMRPRVFRSSPPGERLDGRCWRAPSGGGRGWCCSTVLLARACARRCRSRGRRCARRCRRGSRKPRRCDRRGQGGPGARWTVMGIEPLRGVERPARPERSRTCWPPSSPGRGSRGPFAGGFMGSMAYDCGVAGGSLARPRPSGCRRSSAGSTRTSWCSTTRPARHTSFSGTRRGRPRVRGGRHRQGSPTWRARARAKPLMPTPSARTSTAEHVAQVQRAGPDRRGQVYQVNLAHHRAPRR